MGCRRIAFRWLSTLVPAVLGGAVAGCGGPAAAKQPTDGATMPASAGGPAAPLEIAVPHDQPRGQAEPGAPPPGDLHEPDWQGSDEFDADAWRRPQTARQRSTPPVQTAQLGTRLTKRWATQVGTTTFRTTMVYTGGRIVIGTHGASLKGLGEPSDAVYVLDGATGKLQRTVQPPAGGDRDVSGVAVDGETVFFTTDNGWVVAARLDGCPLWRARMSGKVRPAPALGDLNGDGQVDVVAGDETGKLVALEGASGKVIWSARTGVNDYGNKGFIGSAAIGDLDGDGRPEVVAGGRDSVLSAYRGRDGHVLWQVGHSSGMHASPWIADFDGDGRREVLAAWSYGDVAVLDGATGRELWGMGLHQDDGGIEGLFGTPVPLPGAPGVLIAPTAWWGQDDGVIGVGPTQRMFKSFEGRVSASAVVTDLDGDGVREAIIGTEKGQLLALQADGSRALLATLAGGIEAPVLLADTDGDGTHELLVASRDGKLTCFATGSRAKPFLARFRGNSPHNDGVLGTVKLGWRAQLGSARPSTAPATSGGAVRIDYLRCCTALQHAATRAPIPQNKALLQAAGSCNQLAAKGTDRAKAMRIIARALRGKSTLPAECH